MFEVGAPKPFEGEEESGLEERKRLEGTEYDGGVGLFPGWKVSTAGRELRG